MLPTEFWQRWNGRPFRWGESDCVMFARDALEFFGGRSVDLKIPSYRSRREAAAIIERGGGLHSMVTAVLGEPVDPRQAAIGDIVLTCFKEHGQMLGVADPMGFWLRGRKDLVPVELTFAIEVWPCRR